MPVDSVENAASLVIAGKAERFHLVIGGLTFEEIVIPDLGVFVSQNSILLDYRMGQAWGSAELDALFALFSKIQAIAPSVEIEFPNCPPELGEKFKTALMQFWKKN